jgi:hypothetical protein
MRSRGEGRGFAVLWVAHAVLCYRETGSEPSVTAGCLSQLSLVLCVPRVACVSQGMFWYPK